MSRTHVYWILLATLCSVIDASSDNFFTSINLRRFENYITLQNLLTVYSDNYYAKSSKTSCREEMMQFTTAIESGQTWAMHMLDASSKIPSGILMGNLQDIGMYDQCVGVHPQENVTEIQGRHCTYVLNLPLSTILPNQFNSSSKESVPKVSASNPTIQLILSVCLPSACGSEDVQQIMNDAIELLPKLKETRVTVGESFCSRNGSHTWEAGGIITMIFLLLLVLFLVLCTACEFIKDYLQFRCIETLSRFSLYNNAKTLLRTTSPKNFPVLNGLRFISAACVILGHERMLLPVIPLSNGVNALDFLDSPWSRLVNLSVLSVETFFVISGFLVTYTFLKNMRQGATFNLTTYYFHRYIRLTPHVAAFVLISLSVKHHFGSGAQWDIMDSHISKHCEDNWWLTLLYVQNFKGIYGCGAHLWYLSVDMQLFWLSPIILYPLYRWPKVGLRILRFFLAAAIVTPVALGAFYGYSTILFPPDKGFLEIVAEFRDKHMFAHMRATPWLIGAYLGYLLVDKERRVTKVQVVIGWLLTIVSVTYNLFIYRSSQLKNYEYNMVWEAFNILMIRPVWSASVAWIIFASSHGYGGPIAEFLSLPVFVPLGRLSFAIYLVHLPLQYLRAASIRSSGYYSFIEFMQNSSTDLVMSTVAAFAFSLLFEMPFSLLTEMIIGKNDRSIHPQIKNKVQ